MSNQLKFGNEVKCVTPRHGKSGDVTLNVGIPPELKSELVQIALDKRRTLKSVIAEALESYVKNGVEVKDGTNGRTKK